MILESCRAILIGKLRTKTEITTRSEPYSLRENSSSNSSMKVRRLGTTNDAPPCTIWKSFSKVSSGATNVARRLINKSSSRNFSLKIIATNIRSPLKKLELHLTRRARRPRSSRKEQESRFGFNFEQSFAPWRPWRETNIPFPLLIAPWNRGLGSPTFSNPPKPVANPYSPTP